LHENAAEFPFFWCFWPAAVAAALGQKVTAAVGLLAGATQERCIHPGFLRHLVSPLSDRFEPPHRVPARWKNISRRPDGVGNFQQLVGDYHESDF